MPNVIALDISDRLDDYRANLAAIRVVSREEATRLVRELQRVLKRTQGEAKRVTPTGVRTVRLPGGVVGLVAHLSLQASLSGAAFSSQPDTLK